MRRDCASLKGLKGRPKLTPSGMYDAAECEPGEKKRKGGRRGQKRETVRTEIIKLELEAPPPGSRRRGTVDYRVEDVVIQARTIIYRRARWVTSEGKVLVAPLPEGVRGHVSAQTRRSGLALYHQGPLTVPRLTALPRSIGAAISKRAVERLLNEDNEAFVAEQWGVLRAALEGRALDQRR